ncbi:DegT/DnrJ/EryC1/StrS family aminotransferase [Nonlabens ponticola]|uniref:DegT/DnrJ/EryC1/StrS family aminotransferase n=1 Tax=Nonlabens ponticola TaxID=2496866 RepID=A0A3S9N0K7_9FLAO|nr:DegT/DnrJ/EryC1/StrS family aminotransferase [Nonlabens ponticola]AZQ44914.1 DegT/DnrJ/EryC1/StrS family aminotransferase [Nonlabens ponticola]
MAAPIPYLDLKSLQGRFLQQDLDVMQHLHDSGTYIGGDMVTRFENEFAAYCGVQHCIGVANGLEALEIILRADVELGVLTKAARILVPAHTYIATFLSITNAGCIPVPVDVDELLLTADKIKNQLDNIHGVIAVDIYGKLVDDEVYAFLPDRQAGAKAKKIPIYTDAAQAHGARTDQGMRSGSRGRASAFSFYPTKNLGALGDAGAIVTDDEELGSMCRKIANYGRESRYVNDVLGVNSRLDPLQAGFLSNRLPLLDQDNARRREIAETYISSIKHEKIQVPNSLWIEHNAHHVFPIYSDDRGRLVQHMDAAGIGTNFHYKIPPHHQEVYPEFNAFNFPVTERLHKTQLSIPCHPLLSDQEVQRVIDTVNSFE